MLEKVLEGYTPEKKARDRINLYVFYVMRALSLRMTPLFLKFKVSANQVSGIGIVVGIVGALFIAIGNYWVVIVGLILMQLWLLLDCVDGNIARFRHKFTSLGAFLEDLASGLFPPLLFSSVGVAASKMPGYVPFSVHIPASVFMVLGILSSLTVTLRKLVLRNYQIIYWGGQEQKNAIFFGSGVLAVLYRIAQNIFCMSSFIHIVLLLAAIFELLGLFTIVYFMANTLGMFLNIIQMVRKAISLHV
jgi:phosphatidylglycerophosphate synthase